MSQSVSSIMWVSAVTWITSFMVVFKITVVGEAQVVRQTVVRLTPIGSESVAATDSSAWLIRKIQIKFTLKAKTARWAESI